MLAETRMKLKNAESSIAFLQTQHAEILQGLHAEIQTLQQKCAHLTFELAMKESSTEQQNSDKRFQELKEQLKFANEEVMKLRSTVSIKEEATGLLQHQLREVEQKYKNQIATKESLIQKLQSELDTQSSSIAYLTMKLHQSKQKYRKAMEQLKTFYNSGYMIHTSDSFIEDDIKKLDRNPVRAKTPPVFPVSSSNVTANPRGSKSEPYGQSKTVSRELPQIPVSPHPPSTPRNISTPSSSKVRRTLLRRSTSHTAPSPSNTTMHSSGEQVSSGTSLNYSPFNPLQSHSNITDTLEPGTLNIEALKLGSPHSVLPPIQDGPQSSKQNLTNEAQKFVKTQQLPSESFVGIRKIKNLSSARKVATSNEVAAGESDNRVLVKEDTSRNTH